jgi:hypothetical protein
MDEASWLSFLKSLEEVHVQSEVQHSPCTCNCNTEFLNCFPDDPALTPLSNLDNDSSDIQGDLNIISGCDCGCVCHKNLDSIRLYQQVSYCVIVLEITISGLNDCHTELKQSCPIYRMVMPFRQIDRLSALCS